jgi:AcrR family transcriptional regulator
MSKKKRSTKRRRVTVGSRKDGDVTKNAILAAAEVVFASHGFEGAPMREIAKRAGITQALVHYHFENKENLWEEVVKRRSTAINAFRQAQVEALFATDATPTLERVLEAFYAPSAYQYGGSKATMVQYSQLALSIAIAADERSKRATEKYFDGIARVFIDAFRKCVPELSLCNAIFAYLFALGARGHVHAHNDRVRRLSDGECSNDNNLEDIVKRVIPFAAAGIRQLASLPDQHLRAAGVTDAHQKQE